MCRNITIAIIVVVSLPASGLLFEAAAALAAAAARAPAADNGRPSRSLQHYGSSRAVVLQRTELPTDNGAGGGGQTTGAAFATRRSASQQPHAARGSTRCLIEMAFDYKKQPLGHVDRPRATGAPRWSAAGERRLLMSFGRSKRKPGQKADGPEGGGGVAE